MVDQNTILAALQSGIALAGLLLIFSGFLFTKAASYDTRRGDKFKRLAQCTLIPILAALVLSWISLEALEGSMWAAENLVLCLRITLGVTAIFAIIGILAGTP